MFGPNEKEAKKSKHAEFYFGTLCENSCHAASLKRLFTGRSSRYFFEIYYFQAFRHHFQSAAPNEEKVSTGIVPGCTYLLIGVDIVLQKWPYSIN